MTLDKMKDIIGIIPHVLLIFIIQILDILPSGDGRVMYGFWQIGAFTGLGSMFAGMLGGAALSYFGGMKARNAVKKMKQWRIRESGKDAKRSKDELGRYKDMYSNLSMSNPYLNMEKSMEDLTINQQQTQFERQTFQQSQKNILSALRPSVGASGIASLAQSLVRQGERSEQQVAASVAQQESRNRMLALQQREGIQRLEREGRRIPTDFRAQQIGSMMGMTQQEYEMNKDLQQQYYGIEMNQASARLGSNLRTFNTLLGSMPG